MTKKSKNVSTAAAESADKTITTSVDEAIDGLGEKHPSTAPVPFEEALEQAEEVEEPKSLTHGERLDRLERAYASATGRRIEDV